MAGMNKDDIKSFLRRVPLFSDLSPGEIDGLAAASSSRMFRRRQAIFAEGDKADGCYALVTGRAHVILSGRNGVDILLHVVTPPNVVGEVALVDGNERSASLVALEDSLVVSIPKQAFLALRANPAFEHRLVAGLAETLRKTDDQVRVISTFPARNRVAWSLVRLAQHGGREDGRLTVIPRPSNTDLGEMVGCTRETANRALRQLKARRLVSEEGLQMRLDVEGLRRYLPPV